MYFDDFYFFFPNSLYSYCCIYVHDYYSHIIIFGFFSMLLVSFWVNGFNFKFSEGRNDSRLVEFFLQFFVIILLILMSGPGFWLTQYQGRVNEESDLTLKVVGHQWYWSYEYGDGEDLMFDSFMKSLDDLSPGEFRLFEVDNRCVLPVDINVGFYCTSTDVIHSFSVPKCFMKMDALNGILTKVSYCFPLLGMFYGQCSEICGANHSFMPIVLEVTSLECWKGWLFNIIG
uniref:cytochrome-c oxidase n=1 Tax=Neofoleyellides sp. XM-2022 TaxID=3014012 RepID=A0A9E9JK33_9BILA|nr:cytochrome c oxidase subunit 2 [Neofoleyellides sp. XM-2022]